MGRARSDRQRFWVEVIEEQRKSGYSVADFCRERGLSAASLYSWRRRLAKPADAKKFVAVQLPPVRSVACCEILLSGGDRVSVPPGFDADSLQCILSVLRGDQSGC